MKLNDSSSLQVPKNISEIQKTFELNKENNRLHANSVQKNDPAEKVEGLRENQDQLTLRKIETHHSQFERIAKTFRNTNRSMKNIQQAIGDMKKKLLTVVKQYPPFPKDSIERINALKHFSTLRKEINRLTIPPDGDGSAALMGESYAISHAGKEELYFTDGMDSIAIKGIPIHTDPEGLNIPDLPEDASDDEIRMTLNGLDTAEQKISDSIESLHADIERIKKILMA